MIVKETQKNVTSMLCKMYAGIISAAGYKTEEAILFAYGSNLFWMLPLTDKITEECIIYEPLTGKSYFKPEGFLAMTFPNDGQMFTSKMYVCVVHRSSSGIEVHKRLNK